MSKEIQISKQKLIFFALLLAVLILVAYIYIGNTQPNGEPVIEYDEAEVQSYKKAVYDSLVCQYECPTEEQEFQGTTQPFLVRSCVERCTSIIEERGFDREQFPGEALLQDRLFSDLDNRLSECRQTHVDEEGFPQNGPFYDCVSVSLDEIRSQYEYLA